MTANDEPRYTLAEARPLVLRGICQDVGHDIDQDLYRLENGTGDRVMSAWEVRCRRCRAIFTPQWSAP